MPREYTYQRGDIVVINVQAPDDSDYGLWIVIEHRGRICPDGMLEEVECLSPCGTVVAWNPQYLSSPELKE